jgi:hypothetical protein
LWHCCWGTIVVLESNQVCPSFLFHLPPFFIIFSNTIHLESPIPQNPLIDFGRSIFSHPRKRLLNKHIQKILTEGSLRKRPYSHIGHWEEPKDGMSSDAIVGEQSYLGDNPIFSPSMPTLDDFQKPIIEPIVDPDQS